MPRCRASRSGFLSPDPALLSRKSLSMSRIAPKSGAPSHRLERVAVLPLGGRESPQALAALQTHRKSLRALVARRVALKYAPELRFVLDESFDVQARMDALLRSPQVARDLAHDAARDLGKDEETP